MAKHRNRIGTTTDIAGEFLVMAEALRHGYQAALTMGNAKTVDIFISNGHGQTRRVQVKTRKGPGTRAGHDKWMVGRKTLLLTDEKCRDLVFAFVILNPCGQDHPIYYLAQATDVRDHVKRDLEAAIRRKLRRGIHGKYKTAAAIRAHPMKDFFSRRFLADKKGYTFLTWDTVFTDHVTHPGRKRRTRNG